MPTPSKPLPCCHLAALLNLVLHPAQNIYPVVVQPGYICWFCCAANPPCTWQDDLSDPDVLAELELRREASRCYDMCQMLAYILLPDACIYPGVNVLHFKITAAPAWQCNNHALGTSKGGGSHARERRR
jgi:hypothetical protein